MVIYKDKDDAAVPADTGGPGDKLIQFDPAAGERTGQYLLVELGNPWPDDITFAGGNFSLRIIANGAVLATVPLVGTVPKNNNGHFIVYTGPVGTNTDVDTMVNTLVGGTAANMQADAGVTFTPGGSLRLELLWTGGGDAVVVDSLDYGPGTAWTAADLTADQAINTDGNRWVISKSLQRDDNVSVVGSWPNYVFDDPVSLDQAISLAPGTGPEILPTGAGAGSLDGSAFTAMGGFNTPNVGAVPSFQLFVRNSSVDPAGPNGAVSTIGELGLLCTFANKHATVADTWITIPQQLAQNALTLDNGKLRTLAYLRSANAPKVPVASTIFDQFSVVDATPTAAYKHMVYGRININTAPMEVLRALPYLRGGTVVTPTAPDVAAGIVAYRDMQHLTDVSGANIDYTVATSRATTTGVAGLRSASTDGGFASIGELLVVRKTAAAAPDRPYVINCEALDSTSSPNILGATFRGDFTPPAPAATNNDTVVDDLEEDQLLFNRISNLVTVRSDVFTAYVLLQGRKNMGTAAAPNWQPVAQRRFVATYDRSNVDGSGTPNHITPRVVMFTELR